ncbi:hypothetical protein B5S33_g2298 [[Candida] boidinii]|nr:hypothetical protein B5S30_g1291 [[Candida] boidinii]OWB83667.1 hypothetical protein B5S33_g2298 [[Candida] boidinii]GMG00117.1 unnamed protein product [[Candida] boidinii]
MLKREKEFKERPYKRPNELHQNSKKIGFFTRLRQLFVNPTTGDSTTTTTTITNNENSSETNSNKSLNRASTPSDIAATNALLGNITTSNELMYPNTSHNQFENSQIDISNNTSNVSVLSQKAPTEALADFFKKKGDTPLNDVEVEGVLSLLGKSINHQQHIPSFTNNKDFTSTSSMEVQNQNNTTLNSPSASKSFSSSPKVTKYKQSIPQTTRRRIIHYSSLPSPYRTRISSPLSSYYDSEGAEKDKKLKESLTNNNSEKFLFDPRKKLQNKIESENKKSNFSSKSSNKPISKTAAALLSLLDNKDQISNSINNNNTKSNSEISNPYSNLKNNNKKIGSSTTTSSSSSSSKKSQIKIKKPVSKKGKKFVPKPIEIKSNNETKDSSTISIPDGKKPKKLVRKSSFDSSTFLSEGRTPHPTIDNDYRYEEATSSGTSAGSEIDKTTETHSKPKDDKPFNFNSLVNKDSHKPTFSFTASSTSSSSVAPKPITIKQQNSSTTNDNEPVLKSILKNPIKEKEILNDAKLTFVPKDSKFTFVPKDSNKLNDIKPISLNSSNPELTSTSTSKPMFSFSSDFNSKIKNNTSNGFSLFGSSNPTPVKEKKISDGKEVIPTAPTIPEVTIPTPTLPVVPAIPAISGTTFNGTTKTTLKQSVNNDGNSDTNSSITFKFEFPVIEPASKEILDAIDEDKVKEYQNIYQF